MPLHRMRNAQCAMRKASRRITQLYDQALAPSELKITQRAILAQIGRSQPATMGALADELVMDPGGLAHTLKPLVRDGLVCIDTNPQDRRNRLIRLTAAGKARLEQSDTLWKIADRSFEKQFTGEQAKALREAIGLVISDGFTENFEAALAARG